MSTANKKLNPEALKKLEWERRFLLAAFASGVLASFLFILSFSTEFWVHVELSRPQARVDERGSYFKLGHYHGLWKICREELWPDKETGLNSTDIYYYCRAMYFSLPKEKQDLPIQIKDMEIKMLDFRRSTIAVGFIAIILSVVANVFTWYSLNELRYMYKRLAGVLQLITGGTSWVTLEVFRQMHMYEEINMKQNVPEFSSIASGWSYNLIWFVLILYLLPGVVLLACSRKRKRGKARSCKEARENEPVIMGRF